MRWLGRDSLVGFDSSSEFSGVHRPTRLSPFSRELAPADRDRLSWGSASLRRLRSLVPFSAATGVTRPPRERGSPDPRPVPPSGFFTPRRFQRPTGVGPRSPGTLPPASLPWELHGPVSCRERPWDSPFRAFPSRGAVPPSDGLLLPCGFDSDPAPTRRGRRISQPVSDALRHLATRRGPVKARSRATRSRGRGFPQPSRAPVHRPVARATTATSAPPRRARRHTARTPASKPCSPRESVHARNSRAPELAPEHPVAPRAGALLGFAPPKLCSTTTSGPVHRENTRRAGLAQCSRKTALRSGNGARRFELEA